MVTELVSLRAHHPLVAVVCFLLPMVKKEGGGDEGLGKEKKGAWSMGARFLVFSDKFSGSVPSRDVQMLILHVLLILSYAL